MLSRRQFSKLILGSGALASSNLGRAFAPPAQNAIQGCDLLIKGGTVVDPGQGLHAMLDVAVKDGTILELSPNILAARLKRLTPDELDAIDRVIDPLSRLLDEEPA